MNNNMGLLIMIPTYNEVENVPLIVSKIRSTGLETEILFVDDNSPDGTGKILDQFVRDDNRIHVLHRAGKLGIGSAHIEGIKWACEHGFRTLVTMDADHTHDPEDIPDFLRLSRQDTVVVGSRFINPDSLDGWVLMRKLLTHFGHLMTRNILGLPYDATGAFRAYPLNRTILGIIEMVENRGYAFFYESLSRLHANGIPIAEVPIKLPPRTYGHSKMRFADIANSGLSLISLGMRLKFSLRKMIYATPCPNSPEAEKDAARDHWDAYWSRENYEGKRLYDLIAGLYRRFLFRPALNHFLKRYFVDGSRLLHAGCGSGEVDVDAAKIFHVDALDFSPVALNEYARRHPIRRNLILGNIFEIPSEKAAYDGIFNLGVMEHFTEKEIPSILDEFNRVIKPGGRLVLFWPPSWGLTVNAFKMIHFVLSRLFGNDRQLHPSEHTYITSRNQTEQWLAGSGFELVEFYFGVRDFFSHQVIVAEKRKND